MTGTIPTDADEFGRLIRKCIGEECTPTGAIGQAVAREVDRVKTELSGAFPKPPAPRGSDKVVLHCSNESCGLHHNPKADPPGGFTEKDVEFYGGLKGMTPIFKHCPQCGEEDSLTTDGLD